MAERGEKKGYLWLKGEKRKDIYGWKGRKERIFMAERGEKKGYLWLKGEKRKDIYGWKGRKLFDKKIKELLLGNI